MPTWEAMDETATGRSGRIPFFNEISAMIGIRV
jgi:hypothetical protein